MTMINSLVREFGHETETTRKHLERLPDDRLDWRPHDKSFTARALGSHIVECVGWTDSIFSGDEFNFDPATYKPYLAASVADLLKTFDDNVARGKHAMAGVADGDLMKPWRLKMRGNVRFEKSKADVFRDFTLSHVIHHRGQLSVYLRLLDVPVPGSYGPTADEQG
jgi:uncharacterized damage-inducible protein DinB